MNKASEILGLIELQCKNCPMNFGFIKEEEIKQALQKVSVNAWNNRKFRREYLGVYCCDCDKVVRYSKNEFHVQIGANYYLFYRTY